jgi:hypothetical protein
MGTTPNATYEPERVELSSTPLPKRSETVPAEWSTAADRLLAAIKDTKK